MDVERLALPWIRDIPVYEPGRDAPDAAKLSSNENPDPPHPAIVAALREALPSANRYPPSGSPDLVDALARRHGVTPAEVMVGNGSNEIIDLLVRGFVGREHAVVHPVPSFIVYGLVARISGCRGVGVPCRDYRLDLAAMRDAVDDATRIVFVCNPNNPTSTYVARGDVERFVADLPEHVLVVMDEAYVDYVDAPDFPDSLAMRREWPTVVVLRTFSKYHALAGLRVGYAVADPGVIRTLHRVRQPFNVNRLAQAAALAALSCADELRPVAERTIRERRRVREALLELGVACPPTQTNFVFADLGARDVDLYAELRDRGVVVRRMRAFGATTNAYRITVGTPEENDRLIAGLREVLGR